MLERPELLSLTDAAIARCTVPFPADGTGSIIVRPSTAQRRRRS